MSELGGLLIRPMTERDADAVLAAFDRLSPENHRLRFFSPGGSLTSTQRADLVLVDKRHRWVQLAIDPATGDVVAGARAVVDPADRTEAHVAVTVGECWQRRGLGTLLLRRVAAIARSQKVERLVGDVLVDNVAARRLLASAGAVVEIDEPGVLRFTIPIRQEAQLSAAA